MAVDADEGLGRKTVATLEVEAFLAEQGERDRDPRVDETCEHDEHARDERAIGAGGARPAVAIASNRCDPPATLGGHLRADIEDRPDRGREVART